MKLSVIGFLRPLLICGLLLSAHLGNAQNRDPRQASVFIFDFDGTLANISSYRLFRVNRLDGPFAANISQLPEVIQVPSHDGDGSVGPQILKRLGRFENGRFLPSSSLDPVQLTNGQTIIPGYYYLDENRSFDEFGRSTSRKDLLSAQADQKLKEGGKFLAGAYPFFTLAHNPKYAGMFIPVVLTKRGGPSADMQKFFEKVHAHLELPLTQMPGEAFVNLTHPDFYEFGQDKGPYLRRTYKELSERTMTNFNMPHFMVVFENDRQQLMAIEEQFRALAARGEFANPVVPVLVNLVEEEIMERPQGVDWNRSPVETGREMARVNIYWPDRIERSNNLERVFSLVLGTTEESKTRYSRYSNRLMCEGPFLKGAK